jgi:hypothetical protein
MVGTWESDILAPIEFRIGKINGVACQVYHIFFDIRYMCHSLSFVFSEGKNQIPVHVEYIFSTVTDCGFFLFDQNATIHCHATNLSFRMSEASEKSFRTMGRISPCGRNDLKIRQF